MKESKYEQEDYEAFQNNSMKVVDECLKENGQNFTQELIIKRFSESESPHMLRLKRDEAFLLYIGQRGLFIEDIKNNYQK